MKFFKRNVFPQTGFALALVSAATATGYFLFPWDDHTNLAMLYLLAVVGVAMRGSRRTTIFACVMSVVAFNFFFVPPRFSMGVESARYLFTFAVLGATGLIIGHLTLRLRREAENARAGERHITLVHTFTQQLASVRGKDKVLQTALRELPHVFDGSVTALLPTDEGRLEVASQTDPHQEWSEKERAVAQWVFEKREAAGWGTRALPDQTTLFVPLVGAESCLGVLAVRPQNPETLKDPRGRLLLDSFIHQMALALEVERLENNVRRAEWEAERERWQSSLLSAVSHDFRSPLAGIMGSAETLLTLPDAPKGPGRELLENIRSQSLRLSRLVQKLLEVTRLEAGQASVHKARTPVEEVLGGALDQCSVALEKCVVQVRIPEDLPWVPMDGILMEQVMINLLENAVRHSPPQGRIDILAETRGKEVWVAVGDEGPGVKDTHRVFEKFYREAKSEGAGLGLAICRAVIHGHGGRLWVDNKPTGGALFQFCLPLEDPH